MSPVITANRVSLTTEGKVLDTNESEESSEIVWVNRIHAYIPYHSFGIISQLTWSLSDRRACRWFGGGLCPMLFSEPRRVQKYFVGPAPREMRIPICNLQLSPCLQLALTWTCESTTMKRVSFSTFRIPDYKKSVFVNSKYLWSDSDRSKFQKLLFQYGT